MDMQETEFLRFIEFCAAGRRRGKSVDEICQDWKDQEKRVEKFSELLDKLTTRELALLNAVLKATAGTETG